MAIDVRVEVIGVDQLKKNFGRYRRELPFAEALALTRTAQDVRDAETAGIISELDRPVPFTVRAMGIKTASKTNLESKAFIKDIQREYLNFPIRGDKQGKMLRPANIKLNRYGNIPRRAISRLLSRPDVFYGTIKGITGVWQRGANKGAVGFSPEAKRSRNSAGKLSYKKKEGGQFRSIRLLARTVKSIDYDEQFKFYDIGEREVIRVYQTQFAKALNKAAATSFRRKAGVNT